MTDRFPQILTASTGVAGDVNDYVVATIQLPRGDTAASRGRRLVYELLKVWWYMAIEDTADTATVDVAYLSTTQIRASGDTSSLATIAADVQEPNVIAAVFRNRIVTTSGMTVWQSPIEIDLTDEAGNGVLVATDRMFITGGNVTGTAAGSYTAKILYRVVNVPALEFIGIVQSQISGT